MGYAHCIVLLAVTFLLTPGKLNPIASYAVATFIIQPIVIHFAACLRNYNNYLCYRQEILCIATRKSCKQLYFRLAT